MNVVVGLEVEGRKCVGGEGDGIVQPLGESW